MLTKADDYPVHQTPEPIAYAGTDRNFYDRFFFNGLSADGSVFFAVALGVYPHLDIMDCAVNVIVDGRQHIMRASKHMKSERLDLTIGPVTVEIIEPLHSLRIRVAPNDGPITADLVFTARHTPIEEPRFMRRIGPRAFMDYTRLTQNGSWSGRLSVGGVDLPVQALKFLGTRDRSWGVRPVGAPDSQPPVQGAMSQFYWLWTPANFQDYAVFCHTNDDAFGRPWNRRAVIAPLVGEAREFEDVRFDFDWAPGGRRLKGLTCHFRDPLGEASLSFETGTHFYMQGLGYTHPQWGHGMDKGPLAVTHEVIDLGAVKDLEPALLHIQALSRAKLVIDGREHAGVGVVEQFFIGPHAPSGMASLLDPALSVPAAG